MKHLLDLFFGAVPNEATPEKNKKVLYISFAKEDMAYRNYLTEQAKNKQCNFCFTDMPQKERWQLDDWKEDCLYKIVKSSAVMVLISEHLLKADYAQWEMACAGQEQVKTFGMHINRYKDAAVPSDLKDKDIIDFSWVNLQKYVDSLDDKITCG